MVWMWWHDEIKMFRNLYLQIKTVRNTFLWQEHWLQLPSLTEIQAYARKKFDKLWDEYKRVLNHTTYSELGVIFGK